MLNFVKYDQLIKDAGRMAELIPKHDIVLAIPRSGLIPANVIAERWGVPVTTPELFIEHVLLGFGSRVRCMEVGNNPSVLVVDDSCNKGCEMDRVKKLLSCFDGIKFTYACVYASERAVIDKKIDFFQRLVPQPRLFEWNWLHHEGLSNFCFDIDGVLCREPTAEENDYGPKYEKFLENTEPRFIPSCVIPRIITGRLEKYRFQTEAWLKKHGVKYKELVMRKDSAVPHHVHKLKNLLPDCGLVEDEPDQAEYVAMFSGRAVLCVSQMKVFQ